MKLYYWTFYLNAHIQLAKKVSNRTLFFSQKNGKKIIVLAVGSKMSMVIQLFSP